MDTSEDPQDIIDRLTRERDHWEAEAEKSDIAFQRRTRERDELQRKLDAAEVDRLTRDRDDWRELYQRTKSERDEARKWLRETETRLDEVKAERDQFASELDAADNRPTLDREAVEDAYRTWIASDVPDSDMDMRSLVDRIMALAPAVPSWLGDVPDKPEVTLDAQTATVGGNTYNVYNHTAKGLRAEAWRNLALADAIEAEEAETNDADEARIEEWARKAAHIMAQSACDELGQPYEVIEILIERLMPRGRALVDAGWTPPENKENEA